MVKTAMNRFGWRLPFLAAAMLVFAMSLALFGGETRAVIAAVVFDDTQPLLETADAPTLLSDVLGVSEQRRDPPGHTGSGDAHGSIGHYKIQLATDPNYVGDTTTNAVKVEITVDDVTIDGMQYNVATGGSIAAGTAHRIVELCAKGAFGGYSHPAGLMDLRD